MFYPYFRTVAPVEETANQNYWFFIFVFPIGLIPVLYYYFKHKRCPCSGAGSSKVIVLTNNFLGIINHFPLSLDQGGGGQGHERGGGRGQWPAQLLRHRVHGALLEEDELSFLKLLFQVRSGRLAQVWDRIGKICIKV